VSVFRPFLVSLTLPLVVACGDAVAPATGLSVELHGELRVPPGASGPVHVALYHSWSGAGELRHPLQFIEAFTATPGEYRHRFQYPAGQGEGLVVYAWVDLDGDGVLCTPSYRLDLSGLSEAPSFPAETAEVNVEMTAPCRGPEWFFPRAPQAP
jgi:hypothetical protein